MDRFKFRAWDVVNLEMTLHDSFYELQKWNRAEDELLYFELMQCTGLKDKHGKLIFEGDIVYLAGYGDYDVEFPFIELYEAAAENDIGEIIGNIYENPELIADKC